MFSKLKEIFDTILNLNKKLDSYKKEAIIEAMPSLAHVNRAKKCIEKEDYTQAEKILEEAMELPQEDALVYKYLGIVCERTNRLSDAIIAYKKSANIDNADKEIWKLLGFALMNCNQAEEAIRSFENANKINPANTDIFAGWGMSLMKLKKYTEAHEKFMESVRLNRYNFMSLLLAAVMEVRTGQYNEAESKLNFLVNINPNETNTYEYANLKYIKKDYDSAIHYAKKSLEFNKKMLPSYLLLGKLYVIKENREESLNAYQTALEQGLESPLLYFDWAVTLQIFEEYKLSKLYFLKALTYAPDEKEANAGLALCNIAMDNIDEAIELLEKTKGIDEDNYLYTKALGLLALKQKDFKTAIKKFKSIHNRIFFDNMLNLYLAIAYDKLEETNLAKEYFENALLKAGENINIYLIYSDFLIRNGEYESAQRKLKRALKFDENNTDILNVLFHIGYILVKQNNSEYNIKESLAIADKILSINSKSFCYPEERADLEKIANTGNY